MDDSSEEKAQDGKKRKKSEGGDAPRAKRGCLPKVAALLVSCLVVALLGEVAVRLFLKESTYLFPRYHTGATYGDFKIRRLRSNETFMHHSVDGSWEFKTNSKGFRDTREFGYDKPEGVFRVICLGDSNTQGLEVRQNHTYSKVLERFLNAKGKQAQVINTGVSGFGNAEQLVLLENEGMKYNPDVVVLGFFVNDPADNVRANLFKLEGDTLKVEKKKYQPGVKAQDFMYSIPGVEWLSENSYLYSVFFNTAWRIKKRASLKEGIERTISRKGEVTDYMESLTFALMKRIHEVCRQNGATFIIVEIPQNPTSATPTFLVKLHEGLKANCDRFIAGDEHLGDYLRSTPLHVPNGQKHINELTHALLGVQIGREILAHEGEAPEPAPPSDTP